MAKKLKHGRTETIQTEGGSTRQVWALYERDDTEGEPTFSGKQAVAYFVSDQAARQFSNLQDLMGKHEQFIARLARELRCDATEDQIHRAVDLLIQSNTNLRYVNNSLMKERKSLIEQAEELIGRLRDYLRLATQRPIVIEDEALLAPPSNTVQNEEVRL